MAFELFGNQLAGFFLLYKDGNGRRLGFEHGLERNQEEAWGPQNLQERHV